MRKLAKTILALSIPIGFACPGPTKKDNLVDMNDKYAQGKVTELNTLKEYNDFISTTSLPAVVDFYGSFCEPCKMAEEPFEDSAKEYKGRMRFGKVDFIKNEGAGNKANINSVPTFLFFCHGKEEYRVIGFSGDEELKYLIDKIYKDMIGQ